MVNDGRDPQAAPEPLERVRALLNSWSTPGNGGAATDDFEAHIATLGVQNPAEAAQLRQLRDDLRAVVEHSDDAQSRLNAWIGRLDLRPVVQDGALTFQHRGGVPGDTLALVLGAIQAGLWDRLKACPDCRWMFYDHSRNGSKRWCHMSAGGPEGRSCGSIAKVKRFRDRHKPGGTP